MRTKRRSPEKTGHTGCRRGAPSARTVARKASPTPNWLSKERPAWASSGAAAANSVHVTIRSPPRCALPRGAVTARVQPRGVADPENPTPPSRVQGSGSARPRGGAMIDTHQSAEEGTMGAKSEALAKQFDGKVQEATTVM